MSETPIKSALGLGEEFPFSNGASLPVAPATLADIEDAIGLWYKFTSARLKVQALYLPGDESAKEAKESFEKLLVMASGNKVSLDKIKKTIPFGDEAEEVMAYIDRFLRFIPRSTGHTAEKEDAKEEV